MSVGKPIHPEQIIEDIGGCGRFQVRMTIIAHVTKALVAFSFVSMVMISATPSWWCIHNYSNNSSQPVCNIYNGSSSCLKKTCYINNTKCKNIQFGATSRTLVSEFVLLCGMDYVPSTVMSIQTFGMLAGGLTAGQVSDLFGRKPPYFTGIALVTIFNCVGFLSINWVMFAVARFFIGMGSGMFLATHYCLPSEFSQAKWRSWITGFPSFPIESCLFALIGWLIQDWRYLQLFISLLGLPFLLTWFILPESFRWYLAHNRLRDAKRVIRHVARVNKRPVPNLDTLEWVAFESRPADSNYTPIHLFQSKQLAKTTVLLAVNWMALGLVFYGINFAIQALSGNIFLNIFLFNIAGIPSKMITTWLMNVLGRRRSTALCFVVVAVSGFVVGVVQSVDAPNKNLLVNVFAIIASMGINSAWGPIQTMTIEIYPTVIRNIGFGSLSVIARIGAMVGPQLVYLNTYFPGLLYFVCGSIAVLCILSLLWLPETRNANLSDNIYEVDIPVIAEPLKQPQELLSIPETNDANVRNNMYENGILETVAEPLKRSNELLWLPETRNSNHSDNIYDDDIPDIDAEPSKQTNE